MPEPEEPQQVDTTRPNAARMYDYYLGGSANFAVDREAADTAAHVVPDSVTYARANRAFLGRAMRYLCAQGVDQFLDLGSGIPTKGNVHELARQHSATARVAYVDIEPVAVAHARRLLQGVEGITVTQADVRDPRAVLESTGVADLLDFTRPVAVLAAAILPFVPDDAEAVALVAGYRAACTAGSYLAVSHISQLGASTEQVIHAEEVMARTPTPVSWRTADRIVPLLQDYELVRPGLVPVAQWRPDTPPAPEEVARANSFGAVGYLP